MTDEEYTELQRRYDAGETSNDETSTLEVERFKRERPAEIFAYVSNDNGRVVTWTGDTLGNITWRNRMTFRRLDDESGEWETFREIKVMGINGVQYKGNMAESDGDYCDLWADPDIEQETGPRA